MERYIVGEVSVNWKDGQLAPGSSGRLISQQFEEMVNFNDGRGYFLKHWKLSQIVMPENVMLETVVAVFEKRERA